MSRKEDTRKEGKCMKRRKNTEDQLVVNLSTREFSSIALQVLQKHMRDGWDILGKNLVRFYVFGTVETVIFRVKEHNERSLIEKNASFMLVQKVDNYDWFQPVQELQETDEDSGKDQDIFDINEALGLNLFEGDIRLDNGRPERNSIIGSQYRWPHTIPYVLEDSLEMNAKGLILNAFEQYRLKTCIDFKPWEGEAHYISVIKGSGCWSSVGNREKGRQELSIGANCDRIGTIEHEFLHALGFWHEQSRSDRDDYVTIMRDRIQAGKEGNFNKYDDKTSDFLNVPYDYNSVMHYSKTAFMNGTEPTIVTNIPAFIDVIGQRMDFSEYDIRKLNKLYNCTSSLSFMETCSFESENVCGMIQSAEDNADWQRITHVSSGPQTDHTYVGICQETGYFMHFNTSAGTVMDRAVVKSRFLYPKRGFQCLQFYYYHSGGESDQLNILVKEYTKVNPNGTLRLVKTIQGSPVDYWKLYHVSLNVASKFRLVFEGIKGSDTSNGGLSIDDINLSETQCPHHVWHIRNFTQLFSSSPTREAAGLYSPPFYSPKGYAFQIALYLNGTYSPFNLAIYLHLISGANDNLLQWPCPWQQVTMVLLDQHPDIRQRMSNQRSITTDPDKLEFQGVYSWDRPDKVGTASNFTNGTEFMRGPRAGVSSFITHQRLKSRDFVKDDGIFILTTVEDISHLISTEPNFTTTAPPSVCEAYGCQNGGICILVGGKPVCRCPAGADWWYMGEKCENKGSVQDTVVIAVASSLSVFGVMLIVTIVTTSCVKKKYRKQLNARNHKMQVFCHWWCTLSSGFEILNSLLARYGSEVKPSIIFVFNGLPAFKHIIIVQVEELFLKGVGEGPQVTPFFEDSESLETKMGITYVT
ncbi:meprin A subunit beta [Rhineura floridana]|uniref:meprin A subunit beta n=1 Tax=Rhineura floridana TaxID=261503 RepID=UPI002AC8217F|nr:meprin A subunit beta [Rhineura floridana]